MDAAAREIRVAHGDKVVRYHVPAGAVIIRQKRPAVLEDMPTGAGVQVRYRIGTTEPLYLYDLVDAGSWAWLLRMRRQNVEGEIVSVDERYIVVEDAKEHGRLAYRVTEKTAIEVGGRVESRQVLQPGTRLWIVPRLLPNGAAMATAIADSESAARRLKERAQPSVTGTIRDWDTASRKLTLSTVAGDTRVFDVAVDCIIRKDGRDVPATSLRKGRIVTAHVRCGEDGNFTAHRLTVKVPTAGARRKP